MHTSRRSDVYAALELDRGRLSQIELVVVGNRVMLGADLIRDPLFELDYNIFKVSHKRIQGFTTRSVHLFGVRTHGIQCLYGFVVVHAHVGYKYC